MLQDRLTSLAVLHVHRDIDIDIDIVMRSFTLGKSRLTLRVSFRFDGLAVVNVAQRAFHLLISALNITMSQRKSVLYVINNANYYVF
jgi:hypothetical protein